MAPQTTEGKGSAWAVQGRMGLQCTFKSVQSKKRVDIEVFRYSFSKTLLMFFNRLRSDLSVSDLHKIFTSDWLWIEVCQKLKIQFLVKSILLWQQQQLPRRLSLLNGSRLYYKTITCEKKFSLLFSRTRQPRRCITQRTTVSKYTKTQRLSPRF